MAFAELLSGISVAVAHESPIVRLGLVAALHETNEMAVRFDAASASELPPSASSACAVIFASVRAGMHITGAAVRNEAPRDAAVVLVAAQLGEADVRDALRTGVKGLLLDTGPDELLYCARRVLAGGCYIARPLAEAVALQVRAEPLTGREEQVLALIQDGLCNKAIAQEMSIAVGTVKTHVKAALAKLGVASRAEAAAQALRRGLVRRSVTVLPSFRRGPAGAALHAQRAHAEFA